MSAKPEKDGATFEGIELLPCENPQPPPDDFRPGPGYMRVTTALPEDNARFVAALKEVL